MAKAILPYFDHFWSLRVMVGFSDFEGKHRSRFCPLGKGKSRFERFLPKSPNWRFGKMRLNGGFGWLEVQIGPLRALSRGPGTR